MPVDQELLNRLTTEAAEFLARSLPRHVAGIKLEDRDGHCEIELDCPYQDNQPIRISTAGGEVTLEFGHCHTHFDRSDGSQPEVNMVGEMVVKVAVLVGGYEASYSAWAGERCLGGGWLPTKADGGEQLGHFPLADRLVVVAWEPWDDREIHRTQPGGAESGTP